MKKIIVFTVMSCLLATSMAFADTAKKKTSKAEGTSTVEVTKKAKSKKKTKKPATTAPTTTATPSN